MPTRTRFERLLSELVGREVSVVGHERPAIDAVEQLVDHLFGGCQTMEEAYSILCRLLAYYGVLKASEEFFSRFIGFEAFRSLKAFEARVRSYQCVAMRLFRSFHEAYVALNEAPNIGDILKRAGPRDVAEYQRRPKWDAIDQIPSERLSDLGYATTARVEQENRERQRIQSFLIDLARDVRERGGESLAVHSEATLREMVALLKRFGSNLGRSQLTPLFAPSAERLEEEAELLAPVDEAELARIAETQRRALRNLGTYLTSDYMDVYVATSMRLGTDFISVNSFVQDLFSSELLSDLNIRYFNPTQAWIGDRVSKGLAEAIMLRRASYVIYMAQMGDTFGKDSEASIALGLGKPVIVYVPKLLLPGTELDSEKLGRLSESELLNAVEEERKADTWGLSGRDRDSLLCFLVSSRLSQVPKSALLAAVSQCWADFDLRREVWFVRDIESRELLLEWLDSIVDEGEVRPLSEPIRRDIVRLLSAISVKFEKRARTFRDIHPLGLQITYSRGIPNGVLVARSVEACARLLRTLIENKLEFELEVDDANYYLVEKLTGSIYRVVSRNRLLSDALTAHFEKGSCSP